MAKDKPNRNEYRKMINKNCCAICTKVMPSLDDLTPAKNNICLSCVIKIQDISDTRMNRPYEFLEWFSTLTIDQQKKTLEKLDYKRSDYKNNFDSMIDSYLEVTDG